MFNNMLSGGGGGLGEMSCAIAFANFKLLTSSQLMQSVEEMHFHHADAISVHNLKM